MSLLGRKAIWKEYAMLFIIKATEMVPWVEGILVVIPYTLPKCYPTLNPCIDLFKVKKGAVPVLFLADLYFDLLMLVPNPAPPLKSSKP